MSAVFFSPSRRGFYTAEIHGEAIPADVQRITAARHADLLKAQAVGAEIVATPRGPVARFPKETLAEMRAAASGAVKREARRRILAIAPYWRQLNDIRAIAHAALKQAQGGVVGGQSEISEFCAALRRDVEISTIRNLSNHLEARIANMSSAELAAFDAAADYHWSHADEG
jgi:hypothetical protein